MPWAGAGYGGWAVCSRTSKLAAPGALLGLCGFEFGQLDGEAAAVCVDWYFREGGHDRFFACFVPSNTRSKLILEKIGLVHSRHEDLWNSVEIGLGLLPVYTLDRETYLNSRG